MNTRELRAVVFDLDDTLYPERAYVASGFKAVAQWAETHLGFPFENSLKELQQLFTDGAKTNTFDLWLQNKGSDPQIWSPILVDIYRQHEPKIFPYLGIPALLERLGARYSLAILSDGYLAIQRRKLAALGISSYFDVAFFSDELGRNAWKPSREPFDHLLQKLGVQGYKSVYVADNPLKDFLGARQAGMWTIRFRTPDGLYRKLEPPTSDHMPETEVTTLEELEKKLLWIDERVLQNHKVSTSHSG